MTNRKSISFRFDWQQDRWPWTVTGVRSNFGRFCDFALLGGNNGYRNEDSSV